MPATYFCPGALSDLRLRALRVTVAKPLRPNAFALAPQLDEEAVDEMEGDGAG